MSALSLATINYYTADRKQPTTTYIVNSPVPKGVMFPTSFFHVKLWFTDTFNFRIPFCAPFFTVVYTVVIINFNLSKPTFEVIFCSNVLKLYCAEKWKLSKQYRDRVSPRRLGGSCFQIRECIHKQKVSLKTNTSASFFLCPLSISCDQVDIL